MWSVVHCKTGVIVEMASTRAEAYRLRKNLKGLTDESFRVTHI